MSAQDLFERERPDATPDRARGRRPCVWAIGGGKGGVGKSVVTANLAIAFVERRQRCALVDADFGAANLHTVLGMRAPARSLSHFLRREVPELADVLCPTPIPGLSIVSGARSAPDIANLRHHEKTKLLRHVRKLDVDHVFLDLSAGSAFNALDLFLESNHSVLVVVPEPTSIENTYHFLKAAYFRSIGIAVRRSPERAAIARALDEQKHRGLRSPAELVARIAAIDRDTGRDLLARIHAFRPMLIVNQARRLEHRGLAANIAAACHDYLGCEIRDLGWLERDDCVHDALTRGQPVQKLYPGSPFAADMDCIAARLLEGAPDPVLPRYPRRDLLHPSLYDGGYFLGHDEVALPAPAPRPAPATSDPSEGRAPGIAQPGSHLRFVRERLGLTLAELKRRTHIQSLEHLESERYDLLPQEIYVRGFVQQYARELGIPEHDALARCFVERYRHARGEGVPPPGAAMVG